MIGRGYKSFGTAEPRIHLGLNTVYGTNAGEYTVRFDKYPNNSLHFQIMDGEMHGVSYGERTYEQSGKSKTKYNSAHIYDDEGRFLELIYNPSKKGMFSFRKQNRPCNWIEGQLVKTSPSFVANSERTKREKGRQEGHSRNYLYR